MRSIIFLSTLIFFLQLTKISAQKHLLSTNIGYQYDKGNNSNYSSYYAGQNQETTQDLTLNLKAGKAISAHFIIG